MVSVMLYPCMVCDALSMDLFVWWVACLKVLLGENIRNMFGCASYFVAECDGVIECGWRRSI